MLSSATLIACLGSKVLQKLMKLTTELQMPLVLQRRRPSSWLRLQNSARPPPGRARCSFPLLLRVPGITAAAGDRQTPTTSGGSCSGPSPFGTTGRPGDGGANSHLQHPSLRGQPREDTVRGRHIPSSPGRGHGSRPLTELHTLGVWPGRTLGTGGLGGS